LGCALTQTIFAQVNPIQLENLQTGTANWTLASPATNHEIEGYADLTSVNLGVVGYYTESRTGHQHGFLYSQGSFSPIEVTDSFATFPRGINNSGQVAGYIYSSAGTAGFIYTGGTYKLVRVPGANSTFLLAINSLGDTVGYYFDAARPHGFLYDRSGTLKIIDVPGSSTTLNGIDSQGTIAGTFIDARQHEHAFSYTTSGVFTTIDAPGAAGKLGTVARSINDLGQILIQGSDHFLVNVTP
jgi:uncharacterized membrane protein